MGYEWRGCAMFLTKWISFKCCLLLPFFFLEAFQVYEFSRSITTPSFSRFEAGNLVFVWATESSLFPFFQMKNIPLLIILFLPQSSCSSLGNNSLSFFICFEAVGRFGLCFSLRFSLCPFTISLFSFFYRFFSFLLKPLFVDLIGNSISSFASDNENSSVLRGSLAGKLLKKKKAH